MKRYIMGYKVYLHFVQKYFVLIWTAGYQKFVHYITYYAWTQWSMVDEFFCYSEYLRSFQIIFCLLCTQRIWALNVENTYQNGKYTLKPNRSAISLYSQSVKKVKVSLGAILSCISLPNLVLHSVSLWCSLSCEMYERFLHGYLLFILARKY